MNPRLRCVVWVLLLALLVSCGPKKNKAKLIMIVDQGKAKVLSSSEMNSDPLTAMMNPWQPGAVVLFRTTETVHDQLGKAGEAYVIEENNQLKKIGDFDPKKPDGALQAQFTYY